MHTMRDFESLECLFVKLLPLGERLYSFRFRRMHGENAQQVRDLQNLQEEGRNLAELQIPALGPQHAELANQRPQPHAVDES